MAECIYRRQGQSFKSFLCITANPGDRVTIVASDSRGLDGITNPFTMGNAGKVTLVVKKKGTYKVSGEESNITQTATIIERRKDYNVDVSFKNTVTVKANPYATITLSNYDGVTRSYSAVASSSGVATVTVKRKGTYYVSTSTSSSNTSLSTDPAVTDKVTCDTNNGTKSLIYVRVSNLSGIWTELTSATGGNTKCSVSVHDWGLFAGAECRYKVDSAPGNRSEGTNLFSSGTSGTTGSLTLNRTWYFKVWPYVQINGVKYYGTPLQTSRYTKSTAVYNIVRNDSGSYTVPEACHTLTFALVGGGGGGDGNHKSSYLSGGGGGGGYLTRGTWSVTPGQVIYFTIGSGGSAGYRQDYSSQSFIPSDGGQTTMWTNNNSATANGGQGGGYAHSSGWYNAGSGGSGGGHGGYSPNNGDYIPNYSGGQDGCAAGKKNTSTNPATGSGDGTSRNPKNGDGQGYWSNGTWFGTSYNGVPYSTGGSGGTMDTNSTWGSDGAWGSGNGGSGGGQASGGNNNNYGGNGGSGCVIFSLT